MSTGWYLFLFCFIFGVVASSFNSFGLWDTNYTDSGFTMESSTITESAEFIEDQPITVFVVYAWVVQFIKVIGSGLVAVVSIGGLLYSLGWPIGLLGAALIQIIQLPANLIIFAWMFEVVTGRPVG